MDLQPSTRYDLFHGIANHIARILWYLMSTIVFEPYNGSLAELDPVQTVTAPLVSMAIDMRRRDTDSALVDSDMKHIINRTRTALCGSL